jgi:hypothetical protein
MTVAQIDQCKGTETLAKLYRYSPSQLTEIGCKNNIPADISRFSVDAIQGPFTTLNHSLTHLAHPIMSLNYNTNFSSPNSWYCNWT